MMFLSIIPSDHLETYQVQNYSSYDYTIVTGGKSYHTIVDFQDRFILSLGDNSVYVYPVIGRKFIELNGYSFYTIVEDYTGSRKQCQQIYASALFERISVQQMLEDEYIESEDEYSVADDFGFVSPLHNDVQYHFQCVGAVW